MSNIGTTSEERRDVATALGRRNWALIVVGVLMALYTAYFGWFTLRAHDVYQTRAFDLGIYDQAAWNLVHGNGFRSTIVEGFDTLLADHFEPILLLLAPLYLLWESPKALLLVQTVGLALGALPVYLLARDALVAARVRGPAAADTREERAPASVLLEVAALCLTAVYLLHPAVHSANVFEFHPSALAIPLLVYTLYALRRRKRLLFFVFSVLVMSTKEVMPLTTFAVGLYALLIWRERWMGLGALVLSGLWFVLAVWVVIPHFNPEGQSRYFVLYYGWLGTSFGEILARLVSHPELLWQRLTRADSLAYYAGLLQPVAYLSLLGLPVLLLATPALALNVLSDFPLQHRTTSFFQYAAAIVPFVLVAAVDGIAFLAQHLGGLLDRGRIPPRRTVAAVASGLVLAASVAVQFQHGYLPFSRDFYLAPRTAQVDAAEVIVSQVPPGASVSADLQLATHLSHRESIYLYPNLHDADYLAIDVRLRDGPFPSRDQYDAIQGLLAKGRYGVVDGRHGYLLLERGLDQAAIPDAFYDMARAHEPEPDVSLVVDFGEIRLLGFDLVWQRPVTPRAHLVLYWQALHPVTRDLRLFFVQTDKSGELLAGTELEFAETVWYPPASWQAGETIRTETVYWSAEDVRQFGVAVGVVEGPGFWDLVSRQQLLIRSTPQPLPLLHGDTLLWFTTLHTDGQFARLEVPGGSR